MCVCMCVCVCMPVCESEFMSPRATYAAVTVASPLSIFSTVNKAKYNNKKNQKVKKKC